jgi:hypothetical protein
MSRIVRLFAVALAGCVLGIACTLVLFPPCRVSEGPYKRIPVKEVFSNLIVREQDDRVYSGQIRSEKGLAKFADKYSVDLQVEGGIDFKKQMLIFGITDEIHTGAFQFLRDANLNDFVLDYRDTGIKYKLGRPGEGKKYSIIQVFLLEKIEGIRHVRVKNLVRNGLSGVYD